MRSISILTIFLVVYFNKAVYCQKAVDPAYLRQYYAQLQQQQRAESTPIHEGQGDQTQAQQYVPQNVRLLKYSNKN